MSFLQLAASEVHGLSGDRQAIGQTSAIDLVGREGAERAKVLAVAHPDRNDCTLAGQGQKVGRAIVQLDIDSIGFQALLIGHCDGFQTLIERAGHGLAVNGDFDAWMHGSIPKADKARLRRGGRHGRHDDCGADRQHHAQRRKARICV
ncbi:hypothetical protein D3C80_1614570 [compost metagenome]